jgi:hypothetical protein
LVTTPTLLTSVVSWYYSVPPVEYCDSTKTQASAAAFRDPVQQSYHRRCVIRHPPLCRKSRLEYHCSAILISGCYAFLRRFAMCTTYHELILSWNIQASEHCVGLAYSSCIRLRRDELQTRGPRFPFSAFLLSAVCPFVCSVPQECSHGPSAL